MTPPHAAGIYYLFGFFLFGILFASSCSRRRPLPCRQPFAARPCLLRLLFCVRAGGGGGDRDPSSASSAPHSGTHAAGCDLAGHQVIVSALAGLCFALACVDHVLSWCALLMCRSCVCLRLVCASIDFRVNIS